MQQSKAFDCCMNKIFFIMENYLNFELVNRLEKSELINKIMKKILLISVLFVWSCQKKEADLGNFDLKSFKTDRGGCEGQREKLIGDLKIFVPKYWV